MNLYNYEIKQANGQIRTFKGIENNESKEVNLSQLKQLFISANLTGIIYNRITPTENYIFINGIEQNSICLYEIENHYKELNKLITDALQLSKNINQNKDAYKSLKNLIELNNKIQISGIDFLNDLNEFIKTKKELNIKPIYNFERKAK